MRTYKVMQDVETGEFFVVTGAYLMEACDWYSDGGRAYKPSEFDHLRPLGDFTQAEIERQF
jgi:hypothetical protein